MSERLWSSADDEDPGLVSRVPTSAGGKRKKGEIKWPCGTCGDECLNDAIYCDDCLQWFHRDCLQISKETYAILNNIQDPFLCTKCASDSSGMFDFDRSKMRLHKAALKGLPQLTSCAELESMIIPRCFDVTLCDIDRVNLPADETARSFLKNCDINGGDEPIAVTPDGSCLFNSISKRIRGDESLASELRVSKYFRASAKC